MFRNYIICQLLFKNKENYDKKKKLLYYSKFQEKIPRKFIEMVRSS